MRGLTGVCISIDFLASIAATAATIEDLGPFDSESERPERAEHVDARIGQDFDTSTDLLGSDVFDDKPAQNEPLPVLTRWRVSKGSERASALAPSQKHGNGSVTSAQSLVRFQGHATREAPTRRYAKLDRPRDLGSRARRLNVGTIRRATLNAASGGLGSPPAQHSSNGSGASPMPYGRGIQFGRHDSTTAQGAGDALFFGLSLAAVGFAYALRRH